MNQLLLRLAALLALTSRVFAADRPNILLIAVDDLRPQLGYYGQSQAKSPNLDRLAAQGVLFERAYCMVPTCGASRASLMTSIRPAPKRFVTHLAWAEKEAPGLVTLNTHLRRNGYFTVSNGKIFHHPTDSEEGWSEPAWRPGQTGPVLSPNTTGGGKKAGKAAATDEDGNTRGAPFEVSARQDDELGDGQVARKTIEDLRRLKAKGQPFFLAAGFFKPHLPFIAPKKYWDLHPVGTFVLPANYHPPKDAPVESIHNSGELRNYAGVPKTGPLSDELAVTLIRGYHACVSYTDAQIGRVLDLTARLRTGKGKDGDLPPPRLP